MKNPLHNLNFKAEREMQHCLDDVWNLMTNPVIGWRGMHPQTRLVLAKHAHLARVGDTITEITTTFPAKLAPSSDMELNTTQCCEQRWLWAVTAADMARRVFKFTGHTDDYELWATISYSMTPFKRDGEAYTHVARRMNVRGTTWKKRVGLLAAAPILAWADDKYLENVDERLREVY